MARPEPFGRPALDWTTLVTVEIVILAMIAAFLGLRLYAVLGRRAEHEEETVRGPYEGRSGAPRVVAKPEEKAVPLQPAQATSRQKEMPTNNPVVDRGLREIAAVDRRFDAFGFIEGARSAYRMILEAFWRGDKDELRALCDEDVYQSFASAIDARTEAGEMLDNRLIRIEEAQITGAGVDGGFARITMRFRADIAAVTRDSEGNVIAGSLDDAIEAVDVWTFARAVNSPDPDWVLDETDEG